jgi:uncharacterized protein (DUF2252 family)
MRSFKTLKPGERISVLRARQTLKMARSAHAYVRGSTAKFYEWLAAQQRGTLPEGPAIWICGDCHAGNLGPVADADGRVKVQIRDLDQTVIGNPAHDLIRLALSLATASRGSDLPGVTTAKIMECMIDGYSQTMGGDAVSDDLPETIGTVVRKSTRRTWKNLARERIRDVSPTIPMGEKFWPLSSAENRGVKQLFAEKELHRLATSLRSRDNDAEVEVVDAAYWMKGCSSLGLLRIAALVKIGSGKSTEYSLMDIKEAVSASAPRYKDSPMPKDNAQRVVEGARQLSPYLGERMVAARIDKKSVFVRELLPQDLKFEIEQMTVDEAMGVARFLAEVVGRAHARQMDGATRKRWLKELAKGRTKSLDAPSWLWSSVVSLIASHEVAYLEHCRTYATSKAA